MTQSFHVYQCVYVSPNSSQRPLREEKKLRLGCIIQATNQLWSSFWSCLLVASGFPGGSDGKASASNVGDLGLIPPSGRSPGEGTGYPLQYSCLENSMNRGAWRATVHGVTNSRTWLSDFHTHTHTHTQPAQVSVNRLQESCLQLNSFECAILLSKVIEGSFF